MVWTLSTHFWLDKQMHQRSTEVPDRREQRRKTRSELVLVMLSAQTEPMNR